MPLHASRSVSAALSVIGLAVAVLAWTPLLAHAQGITSRQPGAPPRDTSARPPAKETGTGVLRGRVVALDTGLPLRRARVQLFATGQPRVATTDADGTFTIARLPAGRYDVRASKARYVETPLGAKRPGGQGRPVDLAEGQTIDGILLALPSAGVITGRVVDDIGDVVTGVTIVPMRYRTMNGERQMVPIGRPRTSDDTGTFRLFGLAPGKYYLSARAEDSERTGFGDLTEPDQTGFANTFYPGTASASEAQPIEVVAGSEVVADLQLLTTRLTTISGVVVNAAGKTATSGHLMVAPRSGTAFMWGGGGGSIDGDGTFTIAGVAPGEYTLIAQASFGTTSMFESANGESTRSASVPVVAAGTPIAGLRIVVEDPVRIPVNVSFEDATTEKPDRVFVSASATRAMGGGGMAAMRDGRFSLEVAPGTYRISAGSMSAQPWSVKRLAYRGRELEDDEVELTAEPGGRIDIVFTTKSSSVAGAVTDDSGKPVTDYQVIILPEDAEALRRSAFRRLQVVAPEPGGRFRAQHLQPGRYVATAVPDAPLEDIYDGDFLESVRRAGQPFTLTEGGTATVALKLTPLP